MEKGAIIILFFLFSCTDLSVSPGLKDLEISVINTSTAEICIYRNDSIYISCEDFDINYAPSLHYSKIETGNYLITAKAGKNKKEERISYNGKQGSVLFEF